MNLIERVFRKVLGLFYGPVRFAGLFYGQEGEDIILNALMEEYPPGYKGFYVDIGAHHPWRFSNTYIFYKQQWRGINVDATPGSMKPFRKHRSRDINLELGVGPDAGVMNFYCFNEAALNTFDSHLANERDGKYQYKITKTIPVEVMTLSSLLDQYLPLRTPIDFMTIDVEGLDLLILKSNDWSRYRPKYLLVEAIGHAVGQDSEIFAFIKQHHYEIAARTPRTMILRLNDTNPTAGELKV